MNFKTQLVIATLIVLGGCPIPPITTTTKTDVPTTDTTTSTDTDTNTTEDTGG
jgi:hypothetical protein